MTGGSSSMHDPGLELLMLMASIDQSLRIMAGPRVEWVLAMQINGEAQYVSNTDRAEGMALLEAALERWRAAGSEPEESSE